jgi:ssDNA-binding Zn-finger/Zn-ribbon topoisomerase 1
VNDFIWCPLCGRYTLHDVRKAEGDTRGKDMVRVTCPTCKLTYRTDRRPAVPPRKEVAR